MVRFSLDDDVLKRVFIPDLDSILSYFRKEPIDEQSLKIALKKARMPFVHVSDNNHGKERMRGFEDTTTGNQNLEQVQQAIVLLEANKISYEGHYEDIPAVPLEVNDVNYMIRVGKTTPMQFAPIPHRLSRLVVAKSLSFKDEQVEKEIKRESKKLKFCQINEKNIKNRLSHLSNLEKNNMLNFNQIVTKKKPKYTKKFLPAGKTVPNYDSLLADITAKRAAVDVALVSASSNANNFSCDTSLDPKGDITKYRESMQAVKNALHDYRKSIRNLIVAVAQAGGEKIPSPTPNEK